MFYLHRSNWTGRQMTDEEWEAILEERIVDERERAATTLAEAKVVNKIRYKNEKEGKGFALYTNSNRDVIEIRKIGNVKKNRLWVIEKELKKLQKRFPLATVIYPAF